MLNCLFVFTCLSIHNSKIAMGLCVIGLNIDGLEVTVNGILGTSYFIVAKSHIAVGNVVAWLTCNDLGVALYCNFIAVDIGIKKR